MILTPANINEAVMTLWGRGRLNDAAEAIGCDPRTLKRWLEKKTKPPARFSGSIRRAIIARVEEVEAVGQKIRHT